MIVEKGGLGQFVNLRRDLARKREGVFEGRGGDDTPMHTMNGELSILQQKLFS